MNSHCRAVYVIRDNVGDFPLTSRYKRCIGNRRIRLHTYRSKLR